MLKRDPPKLAALKLLLEVGLERLAVCEAGVVLESNEAFAYYLGYEPAELQGRPLSTFVSFDTETVPDALTENSPQLREATATLRGGKAVAVEVALKTLTGRSANASSRRAARPQCAAQRAERPAALSGRTRAQKPRPRAG